MCSEMGKDYVQGKDDYDRNVVGPKKKKNWL